MPFTKSYVVPHLKRMEQTVQQESPQTNESSPTSSVQYKLIQPPLAPLSADYLPFT